MSPEIFSGRRPSHSLATVGGGCELGSDRDSAKAKRAPSTQSAKRQRRKTPRSLLNFHRLNCFHLDGSGFEGRLADRGRPTGKMKGTGHETLPGTVPRLGSAAQSQSKGFNSPTLSGSGTWRRQRVVDQFGPVAGVRIPISERIPAGRSLPTASGFSNVCQTAFGAGKIA